MWRILKRILIGFILIFVLAISFLGYTEMGLQFILEIARHYYPALTIDRAKGKLLSRWKLEGIHYTNETLKVEIDGISGVLSPWGLLNIGSSEQTIKLNQILIKQNEIAFQIAEINLKATGNLNKINMEFQFKNPGILEIQLEANHLFYGAHFTLAGYWKNLTLFLKKDPLLSFNGKLTGQGHNNDYQVDFSANARGFLNNAPFYFIASLSKTANDLLIKQFELEHGKTHINVKGYINDETTLDWSITAPQISQLLPEASGVLSSEGHLSQGPKQFYLNSFINASNLTYKGMHIASFRSSFMTNAKQEVFFSGNVDQHAFNGQFGIDEHHMTFNHFTLSSPQKTSWSLTSPAVFSWEERIQLNNFELKQNQAYIQLQGGYISDSSWDLKAKINNLNLSFIQPYLPPQLSISGNLNLNADLKAADNKIAGPLSLQIREGIIMPPWTKVPIKNLSLDLNKSHANSLNYTLKGQSGSGFFTLSGKTALIWEQWPSEWMLTGDHLLICDNETAKIVLSPRLNLTYDRLFDLKGAITIHKSSITPPDFSSSLNLPEDVVFIGSEKKTDYFSPNLRSMNINLKTEDIVYFLYHGIEADVSGSLNINALPQQEILGTGQLTVQKGTYSAYKQKLNIAKGQLSYAGNPLTNPGLNLRATKTIKMIQQPGQNNLSNFSTSQNLIVGLDIEGTLDQPKVFLFSEPAILSQADILSYLLFGFPSSQASNNQLSILFGVASTFDSGNKRFSGISDIMGNLEKSLGLSQMGFESSNVYNQDTNSYQRNSSFVVGKQISDKLNVKYSIGMLSPINILTLEYLLSKRWLIRTEASTLSNGIDLLYSYEH